MKKNGFTLVELLAILIILAIIIILLVPKVNKITEKSRIDAAAASALGYIDAVEKFYVDEHQKDIENNIELNGNYDISKGNIKDGTEYYYIKTKGTTPTNGYLTIENGDVISGCLTISKYQIEIVDELVSSVKVGDCTKLWGKIKSLPGTIKTDGYKYLNTPVTVFYNPITGNLCESGETDCKKWYAYSYKNNSVNMILDRNMTLSGVGVEWISETDYNGNARLGKELDVTNMGVGNYDSDGNNDKGPLTALNYIKTNTSNWTTKVNKDFMIYTAKTTNASYKINYIKYKARLITAEEIAFITGNNWNETDAISSLPEFLYENLSTSQGVYGYWTSTPNSTDSSWNVSYSGSLDKSIVNNSTIGIRPVITVSPSIAFSD